MPCFYYRNKVIGMGNIRITFEIPEKVLNQLEDKEGFVKNIDKLKGKRELSPYIVDLMMRDFTKVDTINLETERIAELVSKEVIKELRKLDINIIENTNRTKENTQTNLNKEKLNKLKQLS